jgi:hypothetical protein
MSLTQLRDSIFTESESATHCHVRCVRGRERGSFHFSVNRSAGIMVEKLNILARDREQNRLAFRDRPESIDALQNAGYGMYFK